ncbi:transposase [Pseudorhizobium halotolerans]|uniref:Transposase n=1 Tax=Pseudorhizobium halotolerans TaxID=1233081 RepID=A0ABN7JVB8_9HYPH|nr:transposase [Pseudorhizobium halotolerans]
MSSERTFQSGASGPPLPPMEVRWPPHRIHSLPLRTTCRIVRQVVGEMVLLFGDRVLVRRDRRRLACHVRQIAMYVCHVALRISQTDIGDAFGRDRTTVRHACHVVEDRRDDPVFDDFISAIERIVVAVFGTLEVAAHDG